MTGYYRKRDLERLQRIWEAERGEWHRLVESNNDFQKVLHLLRNKYGLPVHISEFVDWLLRIGPEKESQYSEEVKNISKQHGVPEKWHEDMFRYAATGTGILFNIGLPQAEHYKDTSVLLVDENVDINNPIVQDYIRRRQKNAILRNDPPPRPQPDSGSPRKLDWRPTLEWHLRHPIFTLTDLANLLGYDRSHLSRKLNEINSNN